MITPFAGAQLDSQARTTGYISNFVFHGLVKRVEKVRFSHKSN